VHDAPEEVPGDLVGAEATLPAIGERDAELALKAEDAMLHDSDRSCADTPAVRINPRGAG
jgi:hypothetical protein